jgi:hypothetical protein
MANALYAIGKERMLGGDIDWDAHDIKLVFTDHADDTPAPATDDDLTDISAGTVDTSDNFASKTKTGGVADAADVTVTTVTGDPFESINIYDDTHASDALLVYIDTATGLPFTPSGGDIEVVWDSGASKIFAL